MEKPILCVDFDGVIHSYVSGWQGETRIPDPPVRGALRWLWLATEWWDVQIYSSRSRDPAARQAMQTWMVDNSFLEFGEDHPMSTKGDDYPITFAHEKPAAFLTIDDRAICFDGKWESLDPYELTKFQPWNKREFGATGHFPEGVLNENDEGGLKIGIGFDDVTGLVHVNFGKQVAWFALPPENAIALAKTILTKAGARKVEVEF